MRERPVPNVVEQRGEAHQSHFRGFKTDGFGDLTCHVHRSERVIEASVRSAGVNESGERQLPDPPESLERWGVDDEILDGLAEDEAMNRVADFTARHRESGHRLKRSPPGSG